MESTGDERDRYTTRSLFRIAARVAEKQPAEAERIVARALAKFSVMEKKYWSNLRKRNLTNEELTFWLGNFERGLVPVVYRMVPADADRAERIGMSFHNPCLRAYALGIIAKALVPRDKPRAQDDLGSLRPVVGSVPEPAACLASMALPVSTADHCRGVAPGCGGNRSDVGWSVHVASGLLPIASTGR